MADDDISKISSITINTSTTPTTNPKNKNKNNNNDTNEDTLKVGIIQMSPIWLNRQATTQKMIRYIHNEAAPQKCNLVVFGEALLPGYPFWLNLTDDAATFNSARQKEIHAHYMTQAVQIEEGHLQLFCDAAAQYNMVIVIGCIERPMDRGGHSLYCSTVYINQEGKIASVHRKLIPTYEERLTWSQGDGHGLVVHSCKSFTVGALNCWENWMPLVRSALYAQGEDLHLALWPGNVRNTTDITRFMAMEGRSYVVSACGLMYPENISEEDVPFAKIMKEKAPLWLANGGSCVAAPDGRWILEPVVHTEGLFTVCLDQREVRKERQNLDVVGHYSRPDVLKLQVRRERQSTIQFLDE